MHRTVATVLLTFLLHGCALPPAFVATSSAGDNATYSETGKSMLDYGLSEVVGRDCTLMHGLTRGQFCRDVPKSPIVDATTAKPDEDGTLAPTPEGESLFALTDLTSVQPDAGDPQPAPTAPSTAGPRSVDDARWAFVLGVFRDYEQAAELAGRLKPNKGIVSSVIVQGEVYFRATTRPFKLTQAAENEKPVAAIGIPDAKMVAVCPRWMRDDSCLVLDRNLVR